MHMEIKKLEQLFYAENTHLKEVLDKDGSGNWTKNKERGYGIVICNFNGLKFGIPLRSHIKHDACFITEDQKGLDFSKAVLLIKDEYISPAPFIIPPEEYKTIVRKSFYITQKFEAYVEKYIKGVTKNDENILKPYRFSTLQNYHLELGIK